MCSFHTYNIYLSSKIYYNYETRHIFLRVWILLWWNILLSFLIWISKMTGRCGSSCSSSLASQHYQGSLLFHLQLSFVMYKLETMNCLLSSSRVNLLCWLLSDFFLSHKKKGLVEALAFSGSTTSSACHLHNQQQLLVLGHLVSCLPSWAVKPSHL